MIVYSTHFSRYPGFRGGAEIACVITSTTTPDEFDVARAQYPDYRLDDGSQCGWHALGLAASQGNTSLVEHIVKIGGHGLLELMDHFCRTPLYNAAEKGHFETVQKLIDLGANVNLAAEGGGVGHPPGATPLWAAVAQAHNVAIATLLLRHGAILAPSIRRDVNAIWVLDQAQAELAAALR